MTSGGEYGLLYTESAPVSLPSLKDAVTLCRMTLFGLSVGVCFVLLKHYLGINAI